MDEVQSKFKKTSRNFVYHYLFSPASPQKPTFLFIHGFPSTSYDWYHQINYFQPRGYGLVVPDLVGFGETEPKSTDPADFLHTAIAQDLLDILDEEGVQNVIAVGHDWYRRPDSSECDQADIMKQGFGYRKHPLREAFRQVPRLCLHRSHLLSTLRLSPARSHPRVSKAKVWTPHHRVLDVLRQSRRCWLDRGQRRLRRVFFPRRLTHLTRVQNRSTRSSTSFIPPIQKYGRRI